MPLYHSQACPDWIPRHEAQAQLQLALLGVPEEMMEQTNAGAAQTNIRSPFNGTKAEQRVAAGTRLISIHSTTTTRRCMTLWQSSLRGWCYGAAIAAEVFARPLCSARMQRSAIWVEPWNLVKNHGRLHVCYSSFHILGELKVDCTLSCLVGFAHSHFIEWFYPGFNFQCTVFLFQGTYIIYTYTSMDPSVPHTFFRTRAAVLRDSRCEIGHQM